MNRSDRQKRICDLLGTHNECSVEELAELMKVSGMTIRRELTMLASQGKVVRTHGGARMAERISFEFAFLQRVKENEVAKRAIGRAAAALIKEGDSVLLDSGTTTLAIADHLRGRKQLQVITTSLPIASLLQYESAIEVLLLGGYLRTGSPDLAGALTQTNLESIHADLAFVGADGIGADGWVYNHSLETAKLLRKMIAAAERAYVVGDNSKLRNKALWRFSNLKDLVGLITDSGVEDSVLASLSKIGVMVIKAPGRDASHNKIIRNSA